VAILVTGGAGYIGSVTVERLRAKGEQVVVLDDLARGHCAALNDEVPFYHGKIGDCALLARITREHKIESCIHFAALIEVGESVTEPAKYFENNVGQGIAFIGALMQEGVRRVVLSSTAAVYSDLEQIPIGEQSRQWPKNPYGWSKFFIERLLECYDAGYGLKFVALRYFSAAGATEKCGENHEPESHLIPNVISAALG
jgi:UDP-glucose 4-epimerase